MQNSKEEKEDSKVTDISIYIAALSAKFKPARTPQETTHWFSTDEVRIAIKEIDPSANIDNNQIFDALHQAGYDFMSMPGSYGLHFKWMFREKD